MKPIDNKENANNCLCPKCPLYDDCTKNNTEVLYCARGKSSCKLDGNKMCICGECQVYEKNKLSGGYFCIR